MGLLEVARKVARGVARKAGLEVGRKADRGTLHARWVYWPSVRDPGKTKIGSERLSASAGPVDVRTRSTWMNKWMSCISMSTAG